ncbi:MAG: RICIN domain-containing protein [Salinivirgaceae bacterium]|nr:RICIN domain-containing protein [Salinivirgaceae bacterium]
MKFFLQIALLFFILSSATSIYCQEYIPNGKAFFIQSVNNYGKNNYGYWDFRGRNLSFKNGQSLAVWELSDKDKDRKFSFVNAGLEDGYYWYYIYPQHTNKHGRIDIQGGGINNGTNIQVYSCNNTISQKFRLKHLGEGRWKIYSKTGKILCLEHRSSENGENIHLWNDHTGPGTEWYFIDINTLQSLNYTLKPYGIISDASTGKAIPNAILTAYNSDINNVVPYKIVANNSGQYFFPTLNDIKRNYFMIASAPGYGSKRMDRAVSDCDIEFNFKLDKASGTDVLITNGHQGEYLYRKNGNGFYYVYGDVKNEKNTFFHDNKNRNQDVIWLMNQIGLDGSPALTDEEIYRQAKLVWDFWKEKSVDVLNKPVTNPNHQKAKDFLMNINPYKSSRWPTINEYARCYKETGCLIRTNRQLNSLSFANLLTLTGIPHSKMAIEVMHIRDIPNNEHWAIILNIKNKWFWLDTRLTNYNFPDSKFFGTIPKGDSRIKIGDAPLGYDLQISYDFPYKIYLFPESNWIKVPLCGDLPEN